MEVDVEPEGDGDAAGETFFRRWSRRAITFPALLVAMAAATVTVPLWLPLSLLLDGAARALGRRSAIARASAFLFALLACESVGLAWSALLFVRSVVERWEDERFLAENALLQARWVRALYASGRALFRLGEAIEGELPLSGERPLFVLVRHASTIDTLLPVLLLGPRGFRLRYVLKRELLLDPCLDVVGHRLPNVFVRRHAGEGEREARRVVRLARRLTARDAVVVFPEGTRFSPARRASQLEKLAASGDEEEHRFASSLERTLSPVRRGTMALLAANRGADLVVIAHTGLERARSLGALYGGALVGATLHARVLRVPFERLPPDETGRRALLRDLWREVDRVAQGRPRA